MAWTTDRASCRTFDPANGLELLVIRSWPEGHDFKIIGGGIQIPFSASLTRDRLTDRERKALGVTNAALWYVYGGHRFPPTYQAMIAQALIAHRNIFGVGPEGTSYFVRMKKGAPPVMPQA